MLAVNDRIYVTDAVRAHYFGNETLKLIAVENEWYIFETEESDVLSFVGQEEYFSPAEVEELLANGLFKKL